MSGCILEQIRANFELSELCEKAIGDVLDEKPRGQKAKVWQLHKVSKLVNTTATYSSDIERWYKDEDGKLAEEIQAMKGSKMFPSYYEKLRNLKEFYARNPNAVLDVEPKVDIDVDIPFSGEEVFGKYLDLIDLHRTYCNIPNIGSPNQDYIMYLDKFNTFFYISEGIKRSKPYSIYISTLFEYLSGFFHRVFPLVDLTSHITDWKQQFESNWSSGKLAGWKFTCTSAATNAKNAEPLRLGMFNSVDELEALGLNRLKEALLAMNLKCGGTLQERAERLWSVRGKKWDDIPNKLKASVSKPDDAVDAAASVDNSGLKVVAWKEFYVQNLCEHVLMDIIVQTRKNAEKQQSRLAEEKGRELYEEEHGLVGDSGVVMPDENEADKVEDDDDAPIYNPLNLPLGWDGKPIPYWLYKLHGMGEEFKCEICGNQSYWGRRAFDKHFQEWQHAQGMRSLGIPNTKHFHDIVLIEDALALYNKIKNSVKLEQLDEYDAEYEDSEGNVLNRRTYEDLARQGLL